MTCEIVEKNHVHQPTVLRKLIEAFIWNERADGSAGIWCHLCGISMNDEELNESYRSVV